MRRFGLRARLRAWAGLDGSPVNELLSSTPDRFDRGLTFIAARHERLRSEVAEHTHNGRHGDARTSEDAADVVSELLVGLLADAFGRGMSEDRAQADAAERADLLMDAAHDKLTGAVS